MFLPRQVYITSIILHLGPTLIGGDIVYNPDIGACAFRLGNVTGYIANAMWIVIITMAFVGVGHFLKKLYKVNRERESDIERGREREGEGGERASEIERL